MELTVDKKNALRAWNEADNKGKKLLENLYGKVTFENQNVMDRIKTFEDARDETGRPDIPDFSMLPKDLRKHFEALYKMIVIVEALNEGWKPNWDDRNEYKYYPWFVMSPSAFAFYFSFCDVTSALAGSGSRLRLRTSELAEYVTKQFIDIWKDIQLG